MTRRGRFLGWLLVVAALTAPGAFVLGSALGQQPAPKKDGFGEIEPIEPVPTPVPTLAPLPTEAPAPATPATAEPARKAEPSPTGLPQELLIVLSVGVLVVIATLVVVLVVVLKPPVVINVVSRSGGQGPGGGPAPVLGPDGLPPAEWLDGSMVRVSRAPEGTLKILPGRFIIDDGENPVELRIFRTTGADRVETTIGRDGGPPYRHVQLKPLSVSGRHAKLVFENGIYTIINYSRTNPTAINGDPLPEGASRRLVDEDRIEIGEVLMVYRES